MAQELGRISKPTSAQYEGLRKLLLAPLMYGPPGDVPDGVAALQNYWDQMSTQVKSLASALGGLHRLYHESLSQGGEQGLQLLEQADRRSHEFVKSQCESGAVLEATEDGAVLMETLDLQRCLMLPLGSEKVALQLHEWFNEANKSRYEHIANRIDTTLGGNEVGLLLVSERHQIQFPQDIEVFYVAPPALDEFRRWLRNWAAQQYKADGEPPEAGLLEEDEPLEESPGESPGESPEESPRESSLGSP